MCLPGINKEHPIQVEALQGGPQPAKLAGSQAGRLAQWWRETLEKDGDGHQERLMWKQGINLKKRKIKKPKNISIISIYLYVT